ncbi:hypothetical protein Pan241w_08190 [Gimesia alba]|uniref:Uncharacterized protein n=1 Tax=Gimesia alba TaxID=2527973 RepID=A0A517RA49_9PLAN|nr:hypothetical protein Pan241w_08190 [Gimesia alba]
MQAGNQNQPHQREQTEIDDEGAEEKRGSNPIPDAAKNEHAGIDDAHHGNVDRDVYTKQSEPESAAAMLHMRIGNQYHRENQHDAQEYPACCGKF